MPITGGRCAKWSADNQLLGALAMAPASSALDAALATLKSDVLTCQSLENTLRGQGSSVERSRSGKPLRKRAATEAAADSGARSVEDVLTSVVAKCKQSRVQAIEDAGEPDSTSDGALAQHTRHTDGIALEVYAKFLHYVPRLVNVVTHV